MVQEGKITAEEGMQLLEALNSAQARPTTAKTPPTILNKGARWLRIRITDTHTEKTRVNVRLPINVVTAGIKMGARFSPEVEGLDQKQLMEFIRSGEIGQIVDVYDDEDDEHVEVFLE
jgi:hypothetical protein